MHSSSRARTILQMAAQSLEREIVQLIRRQLVLQRNNIRLIWRQLVLEEEYLTNPTTGDAK